MFPYVQGFNLNFYFLNKIWKLKWEKEKFGPFLLNHVRHVFKKKVQKLNIKIMTFFCLAIKLLIKTYILRKHELISPYICLCNALMSIVVELDSHCSIAEAQAS